MLAGRYWPVCELSILHLYTVERAIMPDNCYQLHGSLISPGQTICSPMTTADVWPSTPPLFSDYTLPQRALRYYFAGIFKIQMVLMLVSIFKNSWYINFDFCLWGARIGILSGRVNQYEVKYKFMRSKGNLENSNPIEISHTHSIYDQLYQFYYSIM